MKNRYLLFMIALICGSGLHAKELPSKISTEIGAYMTSGALGILYGWRYSHYRSEYFCAGGAGYTGQLNGTNNGTFSYGGLTVAISKTYKNTATLEFSLLAGGAGGTLGSTTEGGIVVEPNLALSFVLGDTVHAGINAGYVWLPSAATFSGFSYGVRFDFITDPEPKSANAPPQS